MSENEMTVRKTYSLPSRIVTQGQENEFVHTLTYTPRGDGSCELLCVGDDGLQTWFVCDANGNVTERIEREADGTVSHHAEHKYDKNGNLTNEIYRDSDGQTTKRIEYRYDTDGNETERLQYNNGQLQFRLVYINGADGRLHRMIQYEANGDVTRQVTWEYDERGRPTKCTEFDGMEQYTACYTYGENKDGSRWQCTATYGADGETESRRLEEIDSHDRLTKATEFDADGSVLWAYEHRYGDDGELSGSFDLDGDGRIEVRFVYERDENRGIEKKIQYNGDEHVETTVSVYGAGRREKWFRLTAQTVYAPDGNVIRQAEITDSCEVTLTEAQYETFRWFCGGMLDI